MEPSYVLLDMTIAELNNGASCYHSSLPHAALELSLQAAINIEIRLALGTSPDQQLIESL